MTNVERAHEHRIITDIETGLRGELFVVSIDQGAVYEIFRRR